MKTSILLAILIASTSVASAADWAQQEGSTLTFSGSAQGEAFEGGFRKFTADIRFDPANLDSARFDVSIQLASVDSANSERDDTLRSGEFFNVASTPEAHYLAERFEKVGDGYVARGELTLNGRTLAVPLHFQFKAEAGSATLDGKATLNRVDFNVGSGDWADPSMIDTSVSVNTHLELKAAE